MSTRDPVSDNVQLKYNNRVAGKLQKAAVINGECRGTGATEEDQPRSDDKSFYCKQDYYNEIYSGTKRALEMVSKMASP